MTAARSARHRGMTVVEVMVAMGILAPLLLLLLLIAARAVRSVHHLVDVTVGSPLL